jgi:hypothetical protein
MAELFYSEAPGILLSTLSFLATILNPHILLRIRELLGVVDAAEDIGLSSIISVSNLHVYISFCLPRDD